MVAIDGKTLRRARKMADGVPFVHMVSAWSSACGVVVGQIQDAGADYVFSVKENQPTLLTAVAEAFAKAETTKRRPRGSRFAETREQGHRRIETRRCCVMQTPRDFEPRDRWPSISSILHVQSERLIGDKSSVADRWYISSLVGLDAAKAARVVRSHWQIEIQLHWTLDVVFGEDASRLRAHNASENFAVIRLCLLFTPYGPPQAF